MPEYLTSNSKTSFPFVQSTNKDINSLFLDILVSLPVGTVHSISIVSVDFANEIVIKDNNNTQKTIPWEANATIGEHHWFSFTDNEIFVKIIVTSSEVPLGVLEVNQVILPCCITFYDKTIKNIAVQNFEGFDIEGLAEYSSEGVITEGDVILEEGCNTTLSEGPIDTKTLYFESIVGINFSPGAGTGRCINDCSADGAIYTINGIQPNRVGNFSLAGDDCFVITSRTSEDSHILYIGNACEPCCACDDFYDMQDRMVQWMRFNYGTSARLWQGDVKMSQARAAFNQLRNWMGYI